MSEPSLRSLLTRLWLCLSRRRKAQLCVLLVIMLASALSEMVSLGAVLPFIGVLTAPEKVFNHHPVQELALRFGITDPGQIVLPITIAFAAAALMAGAIRLLMLWLSQRLAFAMGTDLSIEIYRRTLYQPYKVHVARNSSEVISGIISKTGMVIEVIQSVLTTVSSSAIAFCLITILLLVDPFTMSTATLCIGLSYGAISWACRKKIKSNSEIISNESTQIVKALQEGLGGIRDVLLTGSQEVYCETYRKADQPLRRANGSNRFMANGPRFAMEAIGMVLIAGLGYGMSLQPGGVSSGLPVLAALALGAQRLLPVVQLLYNNWVSIASHKSSLKDCLELLEQPTVPAALNAAIEPLEFRKSIEFVDVSFKYRQEGPWIIKGLNLRIAKGSRVGFVGPTGCGKSTLLDILMGLLSPTNGTLLVDEIKIDDNSCSSWQRCIAHVPQSIYLADTTIAENIAFGIPKEQIDMERVRAAAAQAKIADFIERGPNGYNALIGERGIQLSGGQRQRIGIARALYREANVLIFDEATSSLDHITERLVMESIDVLDRELTIFVVAHRLSTMSVCDRIVRLDQGNIAGIFDYQSLMKNNWVGDEGRSIEQPNLDRVKFQIPDVSGIRKLLD